MSKLDEIKQRLVEYEIADEYLLDDILDGVDHNATRDRYQSARLSLAKNAPDDLRALLTVAEAAVTLMDHRGTHNMVKRFAVPISQIATDATGEQLEAMVALHKHAQGFLEALKQLE